MVARAPLAAVAALAAACGSTSPRSGSASSDAVPEGQVAIAIYPTTAIVTERRTVPLRKGSARVRFDDMPLLLDPGSVRFRSLTDPDGTRAVTQTVRREPRPEDETPRWAVVTGNPDRPVRMTSPSEVRTHDPIVEGVTWTVHSDTGGEQQVEVTYQTAGLRWRADYAIVLADDEGTAADMNAWITVDNQSGRTYRSAALSFLVKEKEPPAPAPTPDTEQDAMQRYGYTGGYTAPQPQYAPPQPKMPRYRAYDYGRRVTLEHMQQRQLEWFDEQARDVATRKRIVFDPVGDSYDHDDPEPVLDERYGDDVQGVVAMSVELPAATVAMPPGRARVFQRAADGRLSLLGAAQLEGIEAGEPVRVQLGAVPGLSATRKRTDFHADTTTHRVVEGFEVALDNETDRAETVLVREHLYRGPRWEIPVSSHPASPEGERAVSFEVKVPAEGKAKLRYRVVYSWTEDGE